MFLVAEDLVKARVRGHSKNMDFADPRLNWPRCRFNENIFW